jgi:2-polyprenyl-3-methyl-5-hydroxy-6-metoxy-1,4-benzoquinol methylase
MNKKDINNSIASTKLGNPTYVWQSGQERRLALVEENLAKISAKNIIDVGCGVGAYTQKIHQKGYNVFGLDVETKRIEEAKKILKTNPSSNLLEYMSAVGEFLPFKDSTIDAIILNEVIEHVDNEVKVVSEIERVLANQGIAIIFAPNILFPFETHGCYIGKKFIFKNIPLINWLPKKIRNKLVPHARVYSKKSIENLFSTNNMQIEHHGYIFPGFNNIERRSKFLAKILRRILYKIENGFFSCFGISHFMIVKKIN